MIAGPVLTAEDAAILETFVVPRYLTLFGELALKMMLVSQGGARVAHLGCRVGYPDRLIVEQIAGATVTGVDPSRSALDLARNKSTMRGSRAIEYLECVEFPTPLTSDAFSHVLSLHPVADVGGRAALFREMRRLMYSGGQALIALPLRGSFQEPADLLREYALKVDDRHLDRSVEDSVFERPSIESLSDELEAAGFEDVDVEIRHTTLSFPSGRAFIEDPISRLIIIPEMRLLLRGVDLAKPLEYLQHAIDQYWSEGKFELSLHVGCASARQPG